MPPTQSRLSKLAQLADRELLKELRGNMTDAEMLLWYHLRAKRLDGWKFRRQVPLGPYVVDFLCERARLIVEVDGGQHAERRWKDAVRTRWLNEQGYRVIRFWNNEVLGNIGGVLETLSPALSQGRGRNT